MAPSKFSNILRRRKDAPIIPETTIPGLLDLPVELYHHIFFFLSNDSRLFALGSTCRSINILATSFVFDQYKFDLESKDVTLATRDGSVPAVLNALAISTTVPNLFVHHLCCDLTAAPSEKRLGVASSLRAYIWKLNEVKKITLILEQPYLDGWDKVIWDILSLCLERGCTYMDLQTTKDNRWKDKNEVTKLDTPRRWISSALSVAKRYPLEVCRFRMLPTYLNIIFAQVLNRSNLVELEFKNIYNFREWNIFLDNLRLPQLTRFTMASSFVNSKTDALPRFFSRHPSITSFTVYDCGPELGLYKLSRKHLPNLTHIESSGDCMEDLFPSLSYYSKLSSVKLHVGNRRTLFQKTSYAFSALAQCQNPISLELLCFADHTGHFEHYISRGNFPDEQPRGEDREVSLAAVVNLAVDVQETRFSDNALPLLPGWFRCFPRVEKISFTSRSLPSNDAFFNTFAKQLAQTCKCLMQLTVIDAKGDVVKTIPVAHRLGDKDAIL